MRSSLLLLLLVLLPGCFVSRGKVNRPLDAALYAELTPGTSTAQDAVELLGAPLEVVQLGRRSAYRYDHTHRKSSGLWLLIVFFVNEDVDQDRAWLFFDENNVLTHVGTTFDAESVAYGLPFGSGGDDEEDAVPVGSETDAEPATADPVDTEADAEPAEGTSGG